MGTNKIEEFTNKMESLTETLEDNLNNPKSIEEYKKKIEQMSGDDLYDFFMTIISAGNNVEKVINEARKVFDDEDKSRSNSADYLSAKAMYELKENGKTTVICPKCHKIPMLSIKDNDFLLRCECGYLKKGDN